MPAEVICECRIISRPHLALISVMFDMYGFIAGVCFVIGSVGLNHPKQAIQHWHRG